MRFFHLSDLHLGKRLGEVSLLEDQRYILEQILALADGEKPDAVVIAGDVYDRSVPSAEAVSLLDFFLSALAARRIPVLLVSGNHDSPERLAFAAELLRGSGVYISPVYTGQVEPVTLKDAHGPVEFYLLPFVRPLQLRQLFPEEGVESYTDAVALAVGQMPLEPGRRKVLVTHQYVTNGPGPEELVGSSGWVDAAIFAPFDYVALGHLHAPGDAAGVRVRYCGSPLACSFSDVGQRKSVTVVELGPKGALSVETLPLKPLREMGELTGSYLELSSLDYYRDIDREAYLRVILTDQMDVPDAMAKLRVIYPNLLRLDYARRAGAGEGTLPDAPGERLDPLALFEGFYTRQTGGELTPEQRTYLIPLIEELWKEEGQ